MKRIFATSGALIVCLLSAACGGGSEACDGGTVDLTVNGTHHRVCGGHANLLHGLVFAGHFDAGTAAPPFNVTIGAPNQVGAYPRPRTSDQLFDRLAEMAVTDADGTLYRFDETHGAGKMDVTVAQNPAIAGTFDFVDMGSRVVGTFAFP
jgi:hypothetical protein